MNRSFEKYIERLDKIVALLEAGDAGLEESLKLFAEGAELIGVCRETLNSAQLSVEKLFPEGDKND